MSSHALTLPQSTSLTYFAEGGANVLYKVGLPSSNTVDDVLPSELSSFGPATPLPTELEVWETGLEDFEPDYSSFQGFLLRLRKDLPTLTSVKETQSLFEAHIQPLFTQHELVAQKLVGGVEDLVEQLNVVLRMMDEQGYRPAQRRGVHLAQASFGLLVQDMSARPEKGWTSLEIKPKWLAQSPNAPKGATRCRTCALRAMRRAQSAPSGTAEAITSLPEGDFCPLDLVSSKASNVERAVRAILRYTGVAHFSNEELQKRLVAFFLGSKLLSKVRDLQQNLDPSGILYANPSTVEFRTAMTLRDCSLYLKVPVDTSTRAGS